MIPKTPITLQHLKEKFSLPKPWDSVIIFILNILIAIPVFLIAHQNFIDLDWPIHFDRILLFIIIVVGIQLVLQLVKTPICFHLTEVHIFQVLLHNNRNLSEV